MYETAESGSMGCGAEGMTAEILLAEPRGFCAGVDQAIEIVERSLIKFGPPGATLIFSAHGVSRDIQLEAQARGFSNSNRLQELAQRMGADSYRMESAQNEWSAREHKIPLAQRPAHP